LLELELRASLVLGEHSTAELYSQLPVMSF
jgi:hypothetical protein